jgi:UDP-GlcNAc:undecaprenyl-phosphate GlcNAc-1-phosphate transferase
MITPKLFILTALAFFGTLILTPIVRRLSTKIGAIDRPNQRKVHLTDIPSSGGVAIFFAFLFATLFFNRASHEILGFLIGGTVITGIGLLDDIFDLPPITKFIGQVLAALIVINSGIRVEFLTNPTNQYVFNLGFLSLPFTFFWIVGIANAINFIDGLDGLAAGVSGISAVTLGIVALMSGRYDAGVLAFILAGSSLAFLPHNFREDGKKIFMGDSGSNFLGYSLAVLSIMGIVKVAALFSMLVPMLILAVPIFDTGFAIIRRLIQGKSPFEPDNRHLHHRITELGYTHRQTVFIIFGINILLGTFAVISTLVARTTAIGILLACALILLAGAWKLGIIQIKKEVIKE